MNKFSFWELYTSQWSFKNEGKTLLIHNLISILASLIISFGCGFSAMLLIWPILTLWMFFVYQSIKALVFAPLCYGVYYYAKQGYPELRYRYYEMLNWRK